MLIVVHVGFLTVLVTIHLDGQARLVAIEIQNVGADWMLTPEPDALNPSPPQCSPQDRLSW